MERTTTTNLIGQFVMLLDRYSSTVEITNDRYLFLALKFNLNYFIRATNRKYLTDGISVNSIEELDQSFLFWYDGMSSKVLS